MQVRVLVVAAGSEDVDALTRALGAEFEIVAARAPAAALAEMERATVHVIVCDEALPGAAGVDLLETCRARWPGTVRVLLGGTGDADALGDAIRRAGVSHFVRRPLEPREVRAVIRAAAPPRQRSTPRIVLVAASDGAGAELAGALPAGHESLVETADARGLEALLERLVDADPDAVLVDLGVGTESAARLVTALARLARPVPVVVVADDAGLAEALALVRLGAHDLVLRPLRPEELALRLLRAQERRRMVSQVIEAGASAHERYAFGGLVGGSAAMRAVYALVERVAESDSTVIIRGETGTGKELVARVLHGASRRRQGPLVAVSCAALPEALIESELFGHERGAFTGAEGRQLGRFELAAGGTLFIDEVGDMPPAAQVKILRALQERTIERVGGRHSIPVDVRVVAATHVDLEAAVAAGRFRQDLYYRLNVIEIRLPPLRDRPGDATLLAGHFLEQQLARSGKRGVALAPDALVALEAHAWPGNVRELANVIERAVAITPSGRKIDAATLALRTSPAASAAAPGPASAPPVAPGGIRAAVEQLERALVVRALEAHGGNITRASAQLGITRQALSQKMSKLGLRGED